MINGCFQRLPWDALVWGSAWWSDPPPTRRRRNKDPAQKRVIENPRTWTDAASHCADPALQPPCPATMPKMHGKNPGPQKQSKKTKRKETKKNFTQAKMDRRNLFKLERRHMTKEERLRKNKTWVFYSSPRRTS